VDANADIGAYDCRWTHSLSEYILVLVFLSCNGITNVSETLYLSNVNTDRRITGLRTPLRTFPLEHFPLATTTSTLSK